MSARLDALPWEMPGRSFDGRGSLDLGWREAFIGNATKHDRKLAAGPKSGLTRRGVIYEYIRGHPGAHVRGLAKDLHLATGDLQYHLLWLERHGFVKTRKSGFYRFVFPTMLFKDEEELVLGVLGQETPREILLCLIADDGMTQGELAKTLGHSQPTIAWHLDRLSKLGVVAKRRERMGLAYSVAADKDVAPQVREELPPGRVEAMVRQALKDGRERRGERGRKDEGWLARSRGLISSPELVGS